MQDDMKRGMDYDLDSNKCLQQEIEKALKVVIIVSTFDDRIDRLELFLTVGKYVGECHILLKFCSPDLLASAMSAVGTKTQVHVLGEKAMSGLLFQKAAFKWISSFIERSCTQNLIVHDLVYGWCSIPIKVWRMLLKSALSRSRVHCVMSCFFPNPSFAVSMKWLYLLRQQRKEFWYYVQMIGKRILMDFVSCHSADFVTGNSWDVVRDLRKCYAVSRKRSAIIPNNVAVCHFYPRNRLESQARTGATSFVLFVGSVQRRKGFWDLLQAIKLVKKEHAEIFLVVVGKVVEHEQERVLKEISSLGLDKNVKMAGYQHRGELPYYYSAAYACVVPSYSEGSPRVILEALACGCPVIASDISGSRMIDPEGEFISFHSPGDVDGLKSALQRLVGSRKLRAKKSELGLRRVKARFSTEAVARKWLQFYESIALSSI